MAIESKIELQTGGAPGPVIENEIPAYRAISAAAVTSLVLGLASVFCFTSPWFLLVVLAAVLFGVQAIRSIRRLPDILTGSKIAQAGIGLSLLFGFAATAQVVTQSLILKSEATTFTRMYLEVLEKQTLARAVWYSQPPEYRKNKTPEEIVEEVQKTKNPANASVFDTETEEIRAIKRRLAQPNQTMRFSGIENQLVDGLTHYANALVDIDGPASTDFPETEQFALIQLVKTPGGGRGDWRVREIIFPYKPASTGLEKEHKADDGHGH